MIELMIVVAIIGILAVVAILGYMAYIANAKTSEAKENLKAIGNGAISFFQAEHYSNQGMNAFTKQYPESAEKGIGTAASADTIGLKFSPDDTNVKTAMAGTPWSELKFQITKPFYYYYTYASETTASCKEKNDDGSCKTYNTAASSTNPSRFQASATASLSSAKDSVFCVNGFKEGVISNIYSEDSSCVANKATALTEVAASTTP